MNYCRRCKMPNKKYVVGYKTPPKANMFKPGVSGNPKGRPRAINNFRQKFDKELREKISLKGGIGQIDKASAVTKVLVNKAIKGDMQAVRQCVKLMESSHESELGALFIKRLLKDNFITEKNAERYAFHNSELKLNIGTMYQREVDTLKANDAVVFIEAVCWLDILHLAVLYAQDIMRGVSSEYTFWNDVGRSWGKNGLSQEQKQLLKEAFKALRGVPCPTRHMVRIAVEVYIVMSKLYNNYVCLYRDHVQALPQYKEEFVMMNNRMRRILSEKENRTQAEQNAYVKFALQTEKLHKNLERKEKYNYDDTYLPETDVNMLFDWYEAKMLKDDQLTKCI